MNVITLIGRLTRDPELRYTKDGKAVAGFSLAVDNPWKKDDQGKMSADFFRINVWGKSAESCSKHLIKGQRAGITGRVEIREYQDKDGVKRTSVEVQASDVDFLDRPGSRDAAQEVRDTFPGSRPVTQSEAAMRAQAPLHAGSQIDDSELPF